MRNLYTILFLFVLSIGHAQNPEDLIEGFPASGLPANYYYYKNSPGNVSTPKVAMQPDGKLLVNSGNGLERIDNNVKDLSFNTGTGFTPVYYTGYTIEFIAVQPDGKIIVGGNNFTHYNGIPVNKLIRLNSDGSLDMSFQVTQVWDLVIQPNGKIIVLGRTSLTPALMFRLESNGTLDTTFNSTETEDVRKIALQEDGKLLLYRYSSGYFKIKRFNAEGSLDTTFNVGTGFAAADNITVVATQPDGKILLGGEFSTFNGSAVEDLVRLNADGSADPGFSLAGLHINSVKTVTVDAQNRILIGADTNLGVPLTPASGTLIRLNVNGAMDSSFIISSQINGTCYPQSVHNGALIQPDGKIVIWKDAVCPNLSLKYEGIGRLNPDGAIDSSFNRGGGFNDKINVIAIQPDNKILVGGDFNNFRGETFNYIVRLNPDYTIDRSFNVGSGFNRYVKAIAVDADGKILIGGSFSYFNGYLVSKLVRLNQDGSIDASFIAPYDPHATGSAQGFDGDINAITLQPDGKILVGGNFRNYYDSAGVQYVNKGLMRLHNNSDADSSFHIGLYGFELPVNAIALSPDNRIFVGGQFQRAACCGNYYVDSKYFIILNNNGTISTRSTFLSTPVNALCQDVNGLMLIGTNNGLYRYNGSWYTLLVNGAVKTIMLQHDGKILIGGNITDVNGFPLNSSFVRLNRDGSLDVTFDSRNLFDGTVYTLDQQGDGKIVLGGNFNEYQGLSVRKMAVLRGDTFHNISGTNRLDSNVDGCTAADAVFPYLKFRISNGQTQIPNSTGNYSYSLLAGHYTITPVLENPAYFAATPSSLSVDFPAQGNTLSQNFCITPNGTHPDLEVSLLPITVARPGFDAQYKLVYKNKGNQAQSGTIAFTFNDEVLDVVTVSPAAATVATNERTWNFTNLQPFETRQITIKLNLNTPTETPPLTGGSVLDYVASITSEQTDETPNDNTFTLNQTVVNSYDPNDKTCLQGSVVGTDKIGEYVHYVIRFENTGTYAAQNITVADFIDTDKFDISTLIPMNGSHLFTTKISEGNKVEFVFSGINLPFADATNDGYVAFKIKTKPTLVAGDTFTNGASIYFDYNSAIVTNTYSTLIQTLGTRDFNFANYFTLYPNPVSETLHLAKKDDIELQSVSVYNSLGQLVLVVTNARNTATIDVSQLAAGNYFVKIQSDKGTSNTKFIKQ